MPKNQSKKISVSAPAKVNLALDITGLLDNGYHVLDMIMASTSLADTVTVEKAGPEAAEDEIVCGDFVLDPSNTLSKTLQILRKENLIDGFYKVSLEKNIPAQAGLGGASADAAALLHALNHLENLNLEIKDLEKLGAKTGADVPFCLHDGFARVKGFGEIVEPFTVPKEFTALLVKGENGVSTPAAFALYDSLHGQTDAKQAQKADPVQEALEKGDLKALKENMFNVLEESAQILNPQIVQIKEDMKKAGIENILMSGSGSCLIGFASSEKSLDDAALQLKKMYPFVQKVRIGCSRQSIQ